MANSITFRASLKRRIGKFASDESGNIAVIFAIVLLPVLGFVGAAIDYSRVNNARTKMQTALDSATLMVARDAGSSSLTSAEVETKARAYFNALYTGANPADISLTTTYSSTAATGSTVQVSGSGTLATDFLKVAGFPTLPLATSSSATWGSTKLRVALVLDNTGSMASAGKMAALIPAAQNLIDQLKASATIPGDVYISVVPFAKDVNVGATNYTATWLDWTSWDADTATDSFGTCSKKASTRSSCLKKKDSIWTPDYTNWTGCVTDRTQTNDILNTEPVTGTAATLFVAEQYSDCPVQLMPLSYDWTALKTKIGTMTPAGNTNQSIGLAWGWLSLSQTAPLNAPAEDANYQYKKVIILMTDGLNTQNRWSTDQATIDARQALLCTNIKNAGITLYTIQVNTSGDPTQTVLQNCASTPTNFFILTSATQIMSTFNSIGTSISKLRLAR